jgi:hypothetical protein
MQRRSIGQVHGRMGWLVLCGFSGIVGDYDL